MPLSGGAGDDPETGVYCPIDVDEGYSFLTLVLRGYKVAIQQCVVAAIELYSCSDPL